MTPIEPAHSAGVLLAIAAAAVVLLLVLIMQLKLHAFVSLVLVSLVTAVVAGIPLAQVPKAMAEGFNATLGSVALLVAFGVMLGRLLEVTGGAQVLADTLISRFGERRAPFALGIAALLFGLPIFFDAGLVVFLPIILVVARRFGGSTLLYALPAAAGFAAMHAIVPPHPGPVAAATDLRADMGLTLLVGIPVAFITWFVGGYLWSRYIGRRIHVDLPAILFGDMTGTAGEVDDESENERRLNARGAGAGARVDDQAGPTVAGGSRSEPRPGDRGASGALLPMGETVATRPSGLLDRHAPAFGTVLLLLLLPMALISLNTITSTLIKSGAVPESAPWAGALMLLGQTPVALLITLLVALLTIGRSFGRDRLNQLLDGSLGPIASVVLITGAGGMFGGVLRASGIGTALTSSLGGLGLSLIVQAFLIATLLRVAQGSATVAITTTSGLLSAAVASAGLAPLQLVALVIAIAAGATVLSHFNDSGFWLVGRFFEMDTRTTLRTWTVMETLLGLVAFACALVVWLVGAALG